MHSVTLVAGGLHLVDRVIALSFASLDALYDA
jgi:hypothetical protein